MNFGPDQVARDGLNRLCNALLQNDPEVTKVTTRSAIIDFSMDSMGAIMGRIPEEVHRDLDQLFGALKNNTIVTSLHIDLDNFVTDPQAVAVMINRLQPLLHFLQRSPSLEGICLFSRKEIGLRHSDVRLFPLRVRILEAIVEAMSKNSSIQSLESNVCYFFSRPLTTFLRANRRLRTLAVLINQHDDLAGEDGVDAVARSIGSLLALESLSLATTALYRLLPRFQSLPTLRLLKLDCSTSFDGNEAAHEIQLSFLRWGDDMSRMFRAWSNRSSYYVPVLQTLELTHMDGSVMARIAAYLPTAINLRDLKIDVSRSNSFRHDDQTLPVPEEFLSSLRCNGSLESVEIGSSLTGRSLDTRTKRRIEAYTTRNRTLPKLLPTLFTVVDPSLTPSDESRDDLRRKNQFPTLSASALQAPLMAPKNVLLGLLASSQALRGGGAPTEKRIARHNP